ncbi:MAG: HAD-IIA family hydrolase [Candidatus Sericytochromatia bacterium]
MTTLASRYDCLLCDLDGTLFRGVQPTAGAIETLATVEARILFVTNNASRSGTEVAEHLREMGFIAKPEDVVTSAQTAAHLLASELSADSAVMVVGTEALAREVATVGLRPVRQFSDAPVAVVQGYSPHTCWADLAEAALAIRGGARWLAANVDVTLPTERGLLPGNGAMVAALRAATGFEPSVAGKPQPTLFRDALSRGDFDAPLVVGDRLDTDIAGANAADLPSLMVLTGVSSAEDAIFAAAHERPTFIAADVRALLESPERLRVASHRGWHVVLGADDITVKATDATDGEVVSFVRAVADAVWAESEEPKRRPVVAGDASARDVLRRAVADGVLASDSVKSS